MMVEVGHKDLLGPLIVVRSKSVIEEGVAEMMDEDSLVTVFQSMRLVDAVEAVNQQGLQLVCAAGVSKSFVSSLNFPRPFHDGAAVKETKAASQPKRICVCIERPDILQVKRAADAQERVYAMEKER